MPREKKPEAKPTLTSKEILVVHQTPEDPEGKLTKIRVVQWILDGRVVSTNLEKRDFTRAFNGELITDTKPRGLSYSDVQEIRPKLNEIIDALGAGRRQAKKDHQAAAANDQDLQEVPF